MNLEAAGSTGPELLFQATSEEMIWAYQGVPHPHGTVIANDIFASGIMMSEYVSLNLHITQLSSICLNIHTPHSTDFRQFDQYLLVPGLDLAVVGHSYFYHTSKDSVENIEPGVAQHFAENVLEITKRMTALDRDSQGQLKGISVLQKIRKFTEILPSSLPNGTSPSAASSVGSLPFASSDMGGQQHSRRPDVVFYSLFGFMTVVYKGSTARWLYILWALFCTGLVLVDVRRTAILRSRFTKPTSAVSKADSEEKSATIQLNYPAILARCTIFIVYSLFRSLIYVNCVAFVMRKVLGKQLSWFGGEWRPVGLYIWFSLLG